MATAPPHSIRSLWGAALASLVVLLTLRPPAKALARRALLALPVLVAFVGPLLATGETERGLALSARALAALTTTLAFAATMRTTELPQALSALRLPPTLVELLGSMLRQASAVSSQARRVVLARRLRGAQGHQVSAEVLSSLLVKTAERAERVDLAMRLRGGGFAGGASRRALPARDLPGLMACAATSIAIHLVAL